jgi:hypothetical protein
MGRLSSGEGRVALAVLALLYLPFAFACGWHYIPIPHTDFPSFYWPAVAAFGGGGSPYGAEVIEAASQQLGQQVFPYLYPPPTLLLLYPLTWFEYETAKILALVLNHLAILALGHVLLHRLLGLRFARRFFLLAAAYLFLFEPVAITLNHGQVNLVALLMVCLAWLASKEQRHPALVAIPLVLAILLKTYPALLLVLLLIRREYRAAAWSAGLLVGVSALSLLVLPASLWTEYLTQVVPSAGYGQTPHLLFSPAAPWNQSINGLVARLFLDAEPYAALLPHAGLARAVPYVLCTALVAASVALCVAAGRRRDPAAALPIQIALLLATLYMAAPLSWEHHLVFVLPVALLALQRAVEPDECRVWLGVVVLSAVVLAWDLPLESPEIASGVWTLGISIKLYAVFALWLYTARGALQRAAA